jgi:thiol:disulfide interchange protein
MVSPSSVNYYSSSGSKPPLRWWYYVIGFASLIPFVGLVFVFISLILGIIKLYQGGWKLLLLAMLGFILTAGLTGLYYDRIYQYCSKSNSPAILARPPGASSRIAWLKPAEGLKESQRTQKPILYDFTAEWCGWCKIMDAAVFQNPDYAAKINRMYVPVVVMDRRREEGKNAPEIDGLQSKYKVRGYPSLVIQYPGKSDFKQTFGFPGADQIMSFLTQ